MVKPMKQELRKCRNTKIIGKRLKQRDKEGEEE